MPQIIPIKVLRDTNEISRLCHEKDEPIFVTKNGYGDMVLMSIETYEKSLAQRQLYNQISRGEADIENGNLIAADSALNDLRKEFFEE